MIADIRYSLPLLAMFFYAQTATAITPGVNWEDSYSVDGQCYCSTTYDHEVGDIIVDTPAGSRTVLQICETIGPGPGVGTNPIYNDVQCGNGPPNNAIDEVLCPGRVDIGSEGCEIIGPTWNLSLFFSDPDAPDNSATDESVENPTDPNSLPPEEESPAAPVDELEEETSPTEGTTTDTLIQTGGTTSQPVGLAIAASNFSSKDNRWILFDAQALGNTLDPDSDGTHTNSALDGKYLELLPDLKVTNSDTAASDNVWPIPGDGPQVHFNVNIEQAGTYAVFVRAFSTGEFDDTVHVGFDGTWPISGSDINTCDSRGKWIWSQCDNVEPATIYIPTSGAHSVEFSARDDGFEFDQFVLQLLNDDGSIATQPLIQLPAQNGIESPTATETEAQPDSQTDSQTEHELASQPAEKVEPELGKAVLVGVGSIGLASTPISFYILLISGLCLLLYRYEATAKDELLKARNGRRA